MVIGLFFYIDFDCRDKNKRIL